MTKAEIRMERLFSEIITKLPWTAGIVKWLRNPKNVFIRVPVALLLILGGIFSFLPILGLWMLPFGLILLAIDIIFLQEPVTKAIVVAKRKIPQALKYLKEAWDKMRRWWA